MYGSVQRREESNKKVNEHFVKKINEDVNGNSKLFFKEVINAKGVKVESYSRIKDGNGRLAQGEDEVRKIWKEYFKETQEEDAVHMCGFDGIRRGNYLGGEPLRRVKVEIRVGKLKTGKSAGEDEVTG